MSWERYEDNYGARIALRYPYNANINENMKITLPFPQSKWDGAKGAWSIQDRPVVIEKALTILSAHGITMDGLSGDDCAESDSECVVQFTAPDKLILKWGFQPNYKDINSAMKQAAAGNARWNNTNKSWSIPLATAVAVAAAIRPHYEPLADAIEGCPQVHTAQAETIQRVELSSAVDTDIELPKDKPIYSNMREYQRVAPVMYMTGGRKRILIADEMGLGKSLEALGCVELAGHQRILIVCPAIVKHNWGNEIVKWLNENFFIINGWSGDIEGVRFNIINYDILSKREEHLMAQGYDCIIFDEVHTIKNQKAARTKTALRLAEGVNGIIAMSGTPILNRPNEFFTSLNMMMPATFSNHWTFAQRYCNARRTAFGWDMSGASNIEHSADGITTPLNHLLRDFMLRRSMDDPRIAEEMPDMVQSLIQIDLPEQAQKAYKIEHNSWMEEWMKQQANWGSTDAGFTLNMMTELRHIAGRLKIEAAVKWANDYHDSTGKPLVIFAHHKDVLKALQDRLSNSAMITGDTSSNDRQIIIDGFQTGGYRYLICSTMAMKEGINLERANTTLFVEREWVPAWEQQAAARVRRMTQESATCHQVILSANDTIDSMFDEVVAAKADLVKSALDGKDGVRNAIVNDLKKKLKMGKAVMV
ncbi:MAG: DEAD/DEAH box helicase [Euryarchaeota archaeon]|jgi:SWI/SNF-related matrix-associated actin-dependent regulator of chromatin subfamily A-like protein 1|nr:DEAD/DEAH box helicase [Euryarchaeota archaeon]